MAAGASPRPTVIIAVRPLYFVEADIIRLRAYNDTKNSLRAISGSKFLFRHEFYNFIRRTTYNMANFLQREHSYIFVLFKRIKGLIVNAGFQQLILRDAAALHSLPQRLITEQDPHLP